MTFPRVRLCDRAGNFSPLACSINRGTVVTSASKPSSVLRFFRLANSTRLLQMCVKQKLKQSTAPAGPRWPAHNQNQIMENEQNKSPEQRLAALESIAISQIAFAQAGNAAIVALCDLALGLKKESLSMLEIQGDLIKIISSFAPDTDKGFRAEILTLVRRGESEIDQRQAGLANVQNAVEALKTRIAGSQPPTKI
jgi:hypothetical protein